MLADLHLLRTRDEHDNWQYVLRIENEQGKKLDLEVTNVRSAGALVSHLGLIVERRS